MIYEPEIIKALVASQLLHDDWRHSIPLTQSGLEEKAEWVCEDVCSSTQKFVEMAALFGMESELLSSLRQELNKGHVQFEGEFRDQVFDECLEQITSLNPESLV